MDLERLYAILNETTIQLRKGEAVVKDGMATHIYMMPHVDQAARDLEPVDMEFIVVGVHKELAEKRKEEMQKILASYPSPDRLAAGPSYIEVGGEIGSQGGAFQLFALGQVLGFWKVITPAMFGITGEEAKALAGQGMVMITGYTQGAKQAA